MTPPAKPSSLRYQLEQAIAAARAMGLENFDIAMEGRKPLSPRRMKIP